MVSDTISKSHATHRMGYRLPNDYQSERPRILIEGHLVLLFFFVRFVLLLLFRVTSINVLFIRVLRNETVSGEDGYYRNHKYFIDVQTHWPFRGNIQLGLERIYWLMVNFDKIL